MSAPDEDRDIVTIGDAVAAWMRRLSWTVLSNRHADPQVREQARRMAVITGRKV